MIYLTSFILPTRESEEESLHYFYTSVPGHTYFNSVYPFTIFPEIELHKIDFGPITIFYGGNGCGKSTLLNVISQKVKATRSAPYNTSVHMDEYVKKCSFQTDLRWSVKSLI